MKSSINLGSNFQITLHKQLFTNVYSDQKMQKQQLVVDCKELEAIKNEILRKRQVYNDLIERLGIDGGGGFLKIRLGIQEKQSPQADALHNTISERQQCQASTSGCYC